jgi:hypothetical protein
MYIFDFFETSKCILANETTICTLAFDATPQNMYITWRQKKEEDAPRTKKFGTRKNLSEREFF